MFVVRERLYTHPVELERC